MDSSNAVNTEIVGRERTLAPLNEADRREWWLWASTILVTMLMALGIAVLALPSGVGGLGKFGPLLADHAIGGLLSLVCVFSVYIVYEQMQINRIRRDFADALYQMAVLDPVTDIFNRRYVMHRLEAEIARCERYGSPLTVLAIDLDGFKQINDDHGHATGDYVLKLFGGQLTRATRGSDVVARYGGDEFLAILPECSVEQVKLVLHRMNGLHITTPHSAIEIRYSAGWTDYSPGESVADLLKRADETLYANKRNSKANFVSEVATN